MSIEKGALRMEINGKTKVYGIIGNPIEHTLSPLMHGMFADALGLDMVYVPFHVAEGQIETALRGAYGLNICGMNVTVPYKNAVLPYLTEVEQRAAAAGAVNTLVHDARKTRKVLSAIIQIWAGFGAPCTRRGSRPKGRRSSYLAQAVRGGQPHSSVRAATQKGVFIKSRRRESRGSRGKGQRSP